MPTPNLLAFVLLEAIGRQIFVGARVVYFELQGDTAYFGRLVARRGDQWLFLADDLRFAAWVGGGLDGNVRTLAEVRHWARFRGHPMMEGAR